MVRTHVAFAFITSLTGSTCADGAFAHTLELSLLQQQAARFKGGIVDENSQGDGSAAGLPWSKLMTRLMAHNKASADEGAHGANTIDHVPIVLEESNVDVHRDNSTQKTHEERSNEHVGDQAAIPAEHGADDVGDPAEEEEEEEEDESDDDIGEAANDAVQAPQPPPQASVPRGRQEQAPNPPQSLVSQSGAPKTESAKFAADGVDAFQSEDLSESDVLDDDDVDYDDDDVAEADTVRIKAPVVPDAPPQIAIPGSVPGGAQVHVPKTDTKIDVAKATQAITADVGQTEPGNPTTVALTDVRQNMNVVATMVNVTPPVSQSDSVKTDDVNTAAVLPNTGGVPAEAPKAAADNAEKHEDAAHEVSTPQPKESCVKSVPNLTGMNLTGISKPWSTLITKLVNHNDVLHRRAVASGRPDVYHFFPENGN